MATATKKKTKSIGQVAYLTKQVESLEKDLIRKDIEKLETNLNTKIANLESKVESNFKWLKWILGIGLPLGLTAMLYLHSDTKQDMKDLKQDLKQDINSINTKLDKLIERDLRK